MKGPDGVGCDRVNEIEQHLALVQTLAQMQVPLLKQAKV